MLALGPDRASIEVLVFRDGLLSAVGHDLVLHATAFEISVDPATPAVSARVDAASLRVVGALRDGRALKGALGASDVREIERTIGSTVLHARRYPEIRFASSEVSRRAEGVDVSGALTLGGVTREVALLARRTGELLVAELTLHQPSFGIAPYRAMLGALRVKPDVVVRVSLPGADL